jgi:hypothetical protein
MKGAGDQSYEIVVNIEYVAYVCLGQGSKDRCRHFIGHKLFFFLLIIIIVILRCMFKHNICS